MVTDTMDSKFPYTRASALTLAVAMATAAFLAGPRAANATAPMDSATGAKALGAKPANPVPAWHIGRIALKPVALSAGYDSSCALMSDTTVRCWGDNSAGQLGHDGFGYGAVPRAVTVLGADHHPLVGATQVAVGIAHACAIVRQSVVCWGANAEGQLGIGSTDFVRHAATTVPDLLSDGVEVREIAVGGHHSCALLSNSVVKCWGLNQVEQSGRLHPAAPDMDYVTTPTEVDLGNAYVTHVIAGSYHSCAVTSDGTMCWGLNTMAELGRTTVGLWDMPGISATNLEGAISLVGGASADHVCAHRFALPYACWGRYDHGQLGDGAFNPVGLDNGQYVPQEMIGDPGFEDLAVGAMNTCAIHAGAVYCMGINTSGVLTSDLPERSAVPVATVITRGATDIALGGYHACAIVNGRVQCWGENEGGALGRGRVCDGSPNQLCRSSQPANVLGF